MGRGSSFPLPMTGCRLFAEADRVNFNVASAIDREPRALSLSFGRLGVADFQGIRGPLGGNTHAYR